MNANIYRLFFVLGVFQSQVASRSAKFDSKNDSNLNENLFSLPFDDAPLVG